MSVELVPGSNGSARLNGRLDFESVPQLWPELGRWLKAQSVAHLSLAGVDSANSAALALLLEARELAASHGGRLVLTDLPDELKALAELSNLELADSF